MKTKLYPLVLSTIILILAISASAQPGLEIGIRGGMGIASLSDENTGFVSMLRSFDEFATGYTDNFEAKSKSGFQFGGFVVINLGTSFCIQPEINYSKRGGKIEGEATIPFSIVNDVYARYPVEEEVDLSYIEIPVLAKYRFPLQGNLKPSIFAGPALVLNLSGSDEFTLNAVLDSAGTIIDQVSVSHSTDPSNLKSTSFNFVVGGDVRLDAGSASFVLDIRYIIGTSNVFEDVDPSVFEDVDLIDNVPPELPLADWETGAAPDMKNKVLSITAGVIIPLR